MNVDREHCFHLWGGGVNFYEAQVFFETTNNYYHRQRRSAYNDTCGWSLFLINIRLS